MGVSLQDKPIKFNFVKVPDPPGWDRGWPKLVKGICKECGKEGSEFQSHDFGYLWCSDCKQKFGEKFIESILLKFSQD